MAAEVIVRVEAAPAPGVRETRVGANEVVRPLPGGTVVDRATRPANPRLFTAIFVVVDLPATTLGIVEEAETMKSGRTRIDNVAL